MEEVQKNQESIRACSACKMKHRESHYGKTRLGVPLKTCQNCRNRAKQKRMREREHTCCYCGRVFKKKFANYERHTKVCKFINTHESTRVVEFYHRAFRKQQECFTSVLEQMRATNEPQLI